VFLRAYNRQEADRFSAVTILRGLPITSSSILLLSGRRGNLPPEGKTSENTSFRGCVGVPCRAIIEGPGYWIQANPKIGTEGEQMQQDPNLGRERERVSGDQVGASTSTMSAQDERTWSVIAHLSVLVELIGLMPFGALLVWLLYKDRSQKVRFHALQALWYQIAWIVIFIVYALVTVVLSLVTFGIAAILLVPLGFVLAIVPLAHGCYAAYKVSQGIDYRYPYIADTIEGPRRVV
jgi:uncharacterized protein